MYIFVLADPGQLAHKTSANLAHKTSTIADEILALHPRNKYFSGRNSFSRVLQKETLIFKLFSSYLQPFYYIFITMKYGIDDSYGRDVRRLTKTKNATVATTTSRKKTHIIIIFQVDRDSSLSKKKKVCNAYLFYITFQVIN